MVRDKEYNQMYYQTHKEQIAVKNSKYYREHKEHMRELIRRWWCEHPEYRHQHILTTVDENGRSMVLTRLNKRPYPSDKKCENCGKYEGRLQYHHWDKSDPNKGVWLCRRCHRAVEVCEHPVSLERYLALKTSLESCK
jgi:hypothetical protein